MDAFRKMRWLRTLIMIFTAGGALAYAFGPMRYLFRKQLDPNDVCQKLERGERAEDRWGTPLVYDRQTMSARSAGPDRQMNTPDDLLIGCNP